MRSTWQLAAALTFALAACSSAPARSDQALRLDATSDATAQRSFQRMVDRADAAGKQELAFAMLKLNMEGVQSVYEVVQQPELKTLSIARVKDRVAGMTAEEIIALANAVSSVDVQPAPTIRRALDKADAGDK